jgi:hypothetical protein
VFRNSAFGEALLNDVSDINVPGGKFEFPDCDTATPLVIVANEAFPLRHNLMRPYLWWELQHKQTFNYRLSRAWQVAECSFVLLTKKFAVLQKVMEVSVEKARLVIRSVLHNSIIKRFAGSNPAEDDGF